ncbi:MAG: hypothetical protein AB7S38_14610 [Vulcanimicrobiota bacterium]
MGVHLLKVGILASDAAIDVVLSLEEQFKALIPFAVVSVVSPPLLDAVDLVRGCAILVPLLSDGLTDVQGDWFKPLWELALSRRREGLATLLPVALDDPVVELPDLDELQLFAIDELQQLLVAALSSIPSSLLPEAFTSVTQDLQLRDLVVLADLLLGRTGKLEIDVKNSLLRLARAGFVNLTSEMEAEVQNLTRRGLDLLNIVLADAQAEARERLRLVQDLALGAMTVADRSHDVMSAVNALKDSGFVRGVRQGSIDPLLPLAEIVELTSLGRQLFDDGGDETRPVGPVPTVYPLRLNLHHGGRANPLPLMPRLLSANYEFSVDLSGQGLEALGLPSVFDSDQGRDWTFVVTMFDPGKKKQDFFENSNFFLRVVHNDGPTLRKPTFGGVAFSLFLIPLEDKSAGKLLRAGEGTVSEFHNRQTLRRLLEVVSGVTAATAGVAPLDLGRGLGQLALQQLGANFDGKTPLELTGELIRLHAELKRGRLPQFIAEGARSALPGLVAGLLGPAGIGALGLVSTGLRLFKWLFELEHKHEFELLELDARVDPSGIVLLQVRPEDQERIRLDKNNDGTDGRDLRHILVYHYQPLALKEPRLGLVHGEGKFSLAIVERGEAANNQVVVVGDEDVFDLEPSVSLGMVHLTQPLRDRVNSVDVSLLPDGRVRFTGLRALLVNKPSHNLALQAGVGFDVITSPPFDLARK